jgi:hypothetical protein
LKNPYFIRVSSVAKKLVIPPTARPPYSVVLRRAFAAVTAARVLPKPFVPSPLARSRSGKIREIHGDWLFLTTCNHQKCPQTGIFSAQIE